MGTVSTAQTLTIIGIIYNLLVILFAGMFLFFWFMPIMFLGLIWLLFGIILPIVAYRDIAQGKRGPAGALLLISGVFSLVFVFFIGGVFLVIAGALTADYDPYRQMRMGYRPQYLYNPTPHYGPQYAVPDTVARTKKCVNCGVDLDRWDQYCHTCGAHTGWY
jgi:hypothetical protein